MTYTNTINAIWTSLDDSPSAVADRMIAGKINIVVLELGVWNSGTNGTINYWDSTTNYKNWMNTVKSKSPNIKVLGRAYSDSSSKPDISSSNTRSKMVNSIVSAVNNIGLDGFNEDVEIFTGTKQNLISFWNAMDDALKPLGKISSADVQVWSAYPANSIAPYVHLTYLIPMCYNDGGHGGSSLQNCMDGILTNSISDVLIGLRASASTQGVSLPVQFPVIDSLLVNHTYPKLKGFALWEYKEMSPYWTQWNNWPTKNPGLPVLKWKCSGAPNYVCTQATDGIYNTQAECQAACKPGEKKFSVYQLGNNGVTVVKSISGDKTADEACKAVCDIIKIL